MEARSVDNRLECDACHALAAPDLIERLTKDRPGIEMAAFSDAVTREFFHLNGECTKVECPLYRWLAKRKE